MKQSGTVRKLTVPDFWSTCWFTD